MGSGIRWGAMGLEQVIETINRMHEEGVIGPYAIGGAVGATLLVITTSVKG